MTAQIHPDTLPFFEELAVNNNREWFSSNKLRWDAIREAFLGFTQALIDAMAPDDPAVAHLSARQCVYRIHRDLRFTQDKRPYKTHIACFLPYGGDRTQCVPGYYLQLGQGDYGLAGGCSLGGGIFMPSPKQLAAIRQEIFYCTDEFKAILNASSYKRYYGSSFFTSKKLSRPPKGYAADWPDIDLLKYCDHCCMYHAPIKDVLSDAFADEVVRLWKAALPLNHFIGRALDLV